MLQWPTLEACTDELAVHNDDDIANGPFHNECGGAKLATRHRLAVMHKDAMSTATDGSSRHISRVEMRDAETASAKPSVLGIAASAAITVVASWRPLRTTEGARDPEVLVDSFRRDWLSATVPNKSTKP